MGAWMIRTGRGGTYAADWLEHGVIGIGWDFAGTDNEVCATSAAVYSVPEDGLDIMQSPSLIAP